MPEWQDAVPAKLHFLKLQRSERSSVRLRVWTTLSVLKDLQSKATVEENCILPRRVYAGEFPCPVVPSKPPPPDSTVYSTCEPPGDQLPLNFTLSKSPFSNV